MMFSFVNLVFARTVYQIPGLWLLILKLLHGKLKEDQRSKNGGACAGPSATHGIRRYFFQVAFTVASTITIIIAGNIIIIVASTITIIIASTITIIIARVQLLCGFKTQNRRCIMPM